MPFLDFGSGSANSDMQQAIAALQAVGVPSIQSLSLPELQKYVQAGVLTPQMYQAVQADPQTFQNIANQADQTGTNAQKAALQQLGGIAQTGSTPIMQAQLMNAINTANQNAQANRGAVMENAQERGVAGGGQELLGQLVGNQQAATNANQGALTAGANNAQLALQALANQGNLAGGLQGQQNAQALAKAQAAQQAAQYNSQLQSAANQYNTQAANQAQAANLANLQGISAENTGLANQRTMYNAQVPQQQFADQMAKAQGLAGAYTNQANLNNQQNQGNMGFAGGLLGTAGTLAGAYYGGPAGAAADNAMGNSMANGSYTPDTDAAGYNQNNINNRPFAHGGEVNVTDHRTGLHASAMPIQMNQGGMCYAQGGEVHDHAFCMVAGGNVPGQAQVSGDSTQNDTVPARLSPHEIVLPRSVAQAPNAPARAANFVAQTKGMPQGAGPSVNSFAEALKILEANGLELRLSVGGH